MDALQAIGGAVLLALVFVDVITTTLTLNAHGPISRLLTSLVSRLCRRISGWPGLRSVGTITGAAALVTLFVVWLLLVWAGWALVFASDDMSVVHALTGLPANASDLVYFIGFTIITLGTGDYVPNGPVWQILTVIASATGFFVATMVITYAVSVLSSVIEQRQLGGFLRSMGIDTAEMFAHAWDGEAYRSLDAQLITATQQLHKIDKQHLAYPILHVFLNPDARSTLALAAATLDDFTSVLLLACPASQRPSDAVLVPLRRAQDTLLDTLAGAFIQPESEPPPLPLLPDALQPQAAAALSSLGDRRRLLHGWVRHSGHQWPGCEKDPQGAPRPRTW